jgi:hypothetical protein
MPEVSERFARSKGGSSLMLSQDDESSRFEVITWKRQQFSLFGWRGDFDESDSDPSALFTRSPFETRTKNKGEMFKDQQDALMHRGLRNMVINISILNGTLNAFAVRGPERNLEIWPRESRHFTFGYQVELAIEQLLMFETQSNIQSSAFAPLLLCFRRHITSGVYGLGLGI